MTKESREARTPDVPRQLHVQLVSMEKTVAL
jgi:hypothetical protein